MLLVYDVTSIKSFSMLQKWLKMITEVKLSCMTKCALCRSNNYVLNGVQLLIHPLYNDPVNIEVPGILSAHRFCVSFL